MDVLGVKFSEVTMNEALEIAQAWLNGNASSNFHTVFTPNPEIVYLAKKDSELKSALDNADMLIPDGIGIIIASKMLKKPLPERVPGFDFFVNLCQTGAKTFLFGAKEGVAKMAAEKLPNVVGVRNGYFSKNDEEDIINEINSSGAEILAVCLGAPKQEIWIHNNKDKLHNIKVAVGVGGALDVLAGNVKRAPKIWQKIGMEWLYRAIKQPQRFMRLTVLPKFLLAVTRQARTRASFPERAEKQNGEI